MTVEYDGRKWTKAKTGYYQVTKKSLPGKKWLHQYVYENEIGEIPEGFEVHHKDRDKDNNLIDNLILLSESDHKREHSEYKTSNPERYKKQCEHLDKIRPDHVWPTDPVKYEEHRAALKRGMQNIKPVEYTCLNCGEKFMRQPTGINKFCSNKCSSSFRRRSGVDNIIRNCSICLNPFTINKNYKTQTCSTKCKVLLRGRTIKNEAC